VNKNWYLVDVDITNAINSNFSFEHLLESSPFISKKQHGIWGYEQEQLTTIFTDQWLSYMKSIDLEVFVAMLFYRSPFFTHPEAHVDFVYNNVQPTIALNWVINNPDISSMVWYQTPVNSPIHDHSTTPAADWIKYSGWLTDGLVEIERRTIGDIPTIVRVDIPHNIEVFDKERWSISVRCKAPSTIVNWCDIVNYIKPRIINEQ